MDLAIAANGPPLSLARPAVRASAVWEGTLFSKVSPWYERAKEGYKSVRLRSLFFNTVPSKSHRYHSVSNSGLVPSLWLAQTIWLLPSLSRRSRRFHLERATASGCSYLNARAHRVKASRLIYPQWASGRGSLHGLYALLGAHWSERPLLLLGPFILLTHTVRTTG